VTKIFDFGVEEKERKGSTQDPIALFIQTRGGIRYVSEGAVEQKQNTFQALNNDKGKDLDLATDERETESIIFFSAKSRFFFERLPLSIRHFTI